MTKTETMIASSVCMTLARFPTLLLAARMAISLLGCLTTSFVAVPDGKKWVAAEGLPVIAEDLYASPRTAPRKRATNLPRFGEILQVRVGDWV